MKMIVPIIIVAPRYEKDPAVEDCHLVPQWEYGHDDDTTTTNNNNNNIYNNNINNNDNNNNSHTTTTRSQGRAHAPTEQGAGGE